MGLIYSDTPAAAAGVYTTSLVKAAPVLLDMEHLKTGVGRAILVNSGIANACSGSAGLALAGFSAEVTAETLGIAPSEVQVCSTGVIGLPLERQWFSQGLPALRKGLQRTGMLAVAQAMMTTDTVPKLSRCQVEVDGKIVTIMGMAKGAGMIMPNMATMLCFVMTDAAVAPALLQEMLGRGVADSFNVISVDGDTSTNDSVITLANGRAGNALLTSLAEAGDFEVAFHGVLKELALAIVADGEGATKFITVRVIGAPNRQEAEQVARTIANSALFKTACFGEDANWGRILAAAGRAGVDFDPDQVEIFFDEVQMVAAGCGLPAHEEAATNVLRQPAFTVTLDLGNGGASGEIYTCDLTHEYVTINGDYRT